MTVLEAYPTDEAAMMQLAGIYEVTNRKPEALDLVNEIIRIRREKDATEKARREAVAGGVEPTEQQQGEGGEAMAFFPNQPVRERARKKKPGMLSETERAEMDAKKTEQTTVKYRKLEMLGPAVEQGDQAAVKEWLDTAGDLVDDFRNTRALYPQDRNLKFKGFMTTAQRRAVAQGQVKQIEKMQSRLQESLSMFSCFGTREVSDSNLCPKIQLSRTKSSNSQNTSPNSAGLTSTLGYVSSCNTQSISPNTTTFKMPMTCVTQLRKLMSSSRTSNVPSPSGLPGSHAQSWSATRNLALPSVDGL